MTGHTSSAIRSIFGRELAANLRTFLGWLIPLAAIVAMSCALQPSMAAGPLGAKLDSMPEVLRKAFGIEALDFRRPVAYLATNFTTVLLPTALFGALLGAGAIAREETLRTAELLFALPVGRGRVLVGKAMAAAVYVLALPAALAVIALAAFGAVVDVPLEPAAILALFAGSAAVAVCFAGFGLLAAALVRDKRSATSAAVGIVLGTYFLGVISAIAAPAAPLRWLSPFKLADPAAIVGHGLAPAHVAALVALGVVTAVAAIARYRSQDIHV
jgi:ABC-2 type transport system permease protein